MIVCEFYTTRKDGVNLVRWIDAATDINNVPIRDENGQYIMRGYYIKQNETGIEYTEAIDVEDALYTYSPTERIIVELFDFEGV